MAMNDNINAILSAVKWQDGFRIPVADEENQRLEKEIERKMKLKEDLSVKLEYTEERVKMIKKRMGNFTIEQDMNQNLLNTHSTQLEAEDHRYRLNCNMESSIRREAQNFEKEWKHVNEVILNIEREFEIMTKKIEISKKVLNYDKKSLQELEETLNENEKNNQLIQEYVKEDLKEYKEIELKRQKLSKELQAYREAIIKVSNEVQEIQIVLKQTTRLYDEALNEYRQMFNQWKESVIMLQQRNADIERTLREIEILREISHNKKNVLEESEKFLRGQNENNKLMDDAIKKLEKDLIKLKEEQRKKKESFGMYENQLVIQKNILKELAQRTQQIRADIKHKESDIRNKSTKIEKVEKQVNDLTVKLQKIDNKKLNIEEKAKELEIMIQEQNKKKAAIMKEVNRLQAANLRVTSQIKELEDENKIIQMQYQNECKKIEYLDILYAKDEKTLEEKKEALYQVEFELQKSEMKLDRLQGHELNKSEVERKQKEIEQLQSTLNEKTEIFKLLQKQITSLEHDMRKISNSLASDNEELEYLRNKRQDLVLLMDAGEKQLKSAQNRHEEKLVEESMLRLKVSQMEKMISNLGSTVYDLERYQLELNAAVRERKAEIAVEKESLIIKKRVVSNECSELKCAIAERKGAIKQLQARYDNNVAMLGTNPDGTPVNTTHLKIQNAQERYLLQEEGDKLDETIRKTEYEIQTMENTLRVINVCNDKYKVTLHANKKIKPELEEYKKLDEELQSAQLNLKQKKEELYSLTENLKKMQEDYAQIVKSIDEVQELKENKSQYLVNLKHQVKEQKEKISRAEKSLRNAQRDIQQIFTTTGDKTVLIQQKEVELHEIQEQNSIVLQNIAEFTIHHVEAEAYIKKLFALENMELPPVLLFNQLSIASQCGSSTSNSIACSGKSIKHRSFCASSRESIGNIVQIQPEFKKILTKDSANRNMRNKQLSAKTSLYKRSTKKI